jgi:flagella synthesis protein FlgN
MQSLDSDPGNQLTREYEVTHALLALLRQEQASLVEVDINSVTDLLNEKSLLVAQATDFAVARHHALAAAGFEASETGMQAWIATQEPQSEAAQSWKKLINLAREAKEINRTNGLLINQQLVRNEAALNVLRGGEPNSNVYGPNGQTSARPVSRSRVVG